jgi:hypothetical protein
LRKGERNWENVAELFRNGCGGDFSAGAEAPLDAGLNVAAEAATLKAKEEKTNRERKSRSRAALGVTVYWLGELLLSRQRIAWRE